MARPRVLRLSEFDGSERMTSGTRKEEAPYGGDGASLEFPAGVTGWIRGGPSLPRAYAVSNLSKSLQIEFEPKFSFWHNLARNPSCSEYDLAIFLAIADAGNGSCQFAIEREPTKARLLHISVIANDC